MRLQIHRPNADVPRRNDADISSAMGRTPWPGAAVLAAPIRSDVAKAHYSIIGGGIQA
jgi:hypothetical protein